MSPDTINLVNLYINMHITKYTLLWYVMILVSIWVVLGIHRHRICNRCKNDQVLCIFWKSALCAFLIMRKDATACTERETATANTLRWKRKRYCESIGSSLELCWFRNAKPYGCFLTWSTEKFLDRSFRLCQFEKVQSLLVQEGHRRFPPSC